MVRIVNKLIVHCSATPDTRNVTVEEIRSWHLKRGWKDIGYHYVIYRDGSLHAGRPVEQIGAHCEGQNKNSIGVCLVGDKKFTPEQFNTLKKLYNKLKFAYENIEPFGHRDFTNLKTCPNFEVRNVLCQ